MASDEEGQNKTESLENKKKQYYDNYNSLIDQLRSIAIGNNLPNEKLP